MTVALCGAKRPNVPKRMLSQKVNTTRNSNGTGSLNCVIRSQRVPNKSPLICRARA